jgi:hypothetical protein
MRQRLLLQAAQLQQQWYLANRQVTIASTHAPEEQQILSTYTLFKFRS